MVTYLQYFRIMTHDEGCSICSIVSESSENTLFVRLVKSRSRFVGKQEVWFCEERACDVYALALSTGELIGARAIVVIFLFAGSGKKVW